MLLHYKKYTEDYTFLLKHHNENIKSYLFIITKNEQVPTKIIEEILTIYLIKTDIFENNLVIIIYKDKSYFSKIIDFNKLKVLQYTYGYKIKIKNQLNTTPKINELFKMRIDFYYSMKSYFDKHDYDFMTREKKVKFRLKSLRNYKKKLRLKRLFSFKFFSKKTA